MAGAYRGTHALSKGDLSAPVIVALWNMHPMASDAKVSNLSKETGRTYFSVQPPEFEMFDNFKNL